MGPGAAKFLHRAETALTPLSAARRSRLRFIRAAEAARERLVWGSQGVSCPIGTRDSAPEREGGWLELALGLVACLDAADDFTHRITSQLKFQLSVNESIVCVKNFK